MERGFRTGPEDFRCCVRKGIYALPDLLDRLFSRTDWNEVKMRNLIPSQPHLKTTMGPSSEGQDEVDEGMMIILKQLAEVHR